MKEKKYIAVVDIPSLCLKAGDEFSGPVADVLVNNGKAKAAPEEQPKPKTKEASK